MLSKLAENCNVCITHGGSAGSETDDCADENEVAQHHNSFLKFYKAATAFEIDEQRSAARGKHLQNGGAERK